MPGSHRGEGAQHTSAPGEGCEGQAVAFPHEQWEERGGCSALAAAPTHPARYHAPQAAAESRCSKMGTAERKRQQISRGRATASTGRHALRMVYRLLSHPSGWGTCGDEAVATTATSPGAEAAAIRSQLLDTGQGLDNRFQTAAAGDGERMDLQARSQGLRRAGRAFQRSLCGTELQGGLARQDKELAIGKVKSANGAPSYGSGRSLRGKRCHGVTSPSCKALTFPETPQPGKQPFPNRCERKAAPWGTPCSL